MVFSTLPDTRLPRFRDFYDSASFPKVTLRDMKVPHYDCKAECEAFFADFPIKTFVMAGAYYSNLYKYGFLSRNERTGGKLAVTLCVDRDTVYPGMDLEDFGKVVAGVFKAGAAADNERVYVVSDPMTVGEVMDVVGKVREGGGGGVVVFGMEVVVDWEGRAGRDGGQGEGGRGRWGVVGR